jgi:hypothetical protein
MALIALGEDMLPGCVSVLPGVGRKLLQSLRRQLAKKLMPAENLALPERPVVDVHGQTPGAASILPDANVSDAMKLVPRLFHAPVTPRVRQLTPWKSGSCQDHGLFWGGEPCPAVFLLMD